MSTFIYGWKDQLTIGELGEAHFQSDYSFLDPVKSHVDLTVDFLVDSERIEVKTDTYGLTTGNYFMEFDCEGKLCGPWRALRDNCGWYVYYFINDREYHWFPSGKLVKALDKRIEQGEAKKRWVNNDGWSAFGYLIPRKSVEGLVMRHPIKN